MKTKFLLPHKFKIFGWILFAISILLYISDIAFGDIPLLAKAKILCVYHSDDFPFVKNPPNKFFQMQEVNLEPDIIGILLITGCLLVAFSRLKVEDEYTAKIRLESLVWATFANFILLILAILTIWGRDFITVMEYNMVTILILFVIRFHYVLFQSGKIKSE